MADDGLGRRERERRRHRREMLEAAERVFVRDGYHGATIERIAQEADFAVGTIYNFFESKEKLFEEVITGLTREGFGLLKEKVFDEPDPMKALEALIELRLTFPQEHRDFGRVFYETAPAAGDDLSRALPESCQALHRQYMESVAGLMSKGVAAKVFRNEDPVCLALCFEGAMQTVGVYWTPEEPEEPLSERKADVRRILLGMVCGSERDREERGRG